MRIADLTGSLTFSLTAYSLAGGITTTGVRFFAIRVG
jgi:hypothetical protein